MSEVPLYYERGGSLAQGVGFTVECKLARLRLRVSGSGFRI